MTLKLHVFYESRMTLSTRLLQFSSYYFFNWGLYWAASKQCLAEHQSFLFEERHCWIAKRSLLCVRLWCDAPSLIADFFSRAQSEALSSKLKQVCSFCCDITCIACEDAQHDFDSACHFSSNNYPLSEAPLNLSWQLANPHGQSKLQEN